MTRTDGESRTYDTLRLNVEDHLMITEGSTCRNIQLCIGNTGQGSQGYEGHFSDEYLPRYAGFMYVRSLVSHVVK